MTDDGLTQMGDDGLDDRELPELACMHEIKWALEAFVHRGDRGARVFLGEQLAVRRHWVRVYERHGVFKRVRMLAREMNAIVAGITASFIEN